METSVFKKSKSHLSNEIALGTLSNIKVKTLVYLGAEGSVCMGPLPAGIRGSAEGQGSEPLDQIQSTCLQIRRLRPESSEDVFVLTQLISNKARSRS